MSGQAMTRRVEAVSGAAQGLGAADRTPARGRRFPLVLLDLGPDVFKEQQLAVLKRRDR
jgi:hypothetical protein